MLWSLKEWKPAIAMVVFDIIFAVMTGLIKKALDEGMSKLVIITLRQIVAVIFIAPIAFFKERNARPKLTSEICMLFFLSALLGAALPQYLFFLGMQYTTATFASTFANLPPVVTFLLALLFRMETVNIKSKAGMAKTLGALLSLIGAMVLTLYKGVPLTHKTTHQNSPLNSTKMGPNSNPKKWMLGSAAMVANVVAFSLWLLQQKKILEKYPAVYSSTALVSFLSFLQVAGLAVAIERSPSVWLPKGTVQIIAVVYSGVAASGIGFVLMTWAVQKRGAVFTSAFIPLIQIFVALIDFAFLHEPLYFGSVLGSVLLIAGLYLLLWGKKKEASIHSEKLPEINQE
ncbi:WAT1-related protein [Rhynchospora pubera]|uniref:WAT1-related protein n=1 Tax=Rhynchospora pubera TaxID=906938 RepID=A0AAV8GL03_9POAL|nr:WAT1-related protein [Rhynchospora pubera]KAJ4783566.1 WAT1-related protein [Rhynchospora pubera]KAJ4804116.1 WAT1-related protein [Rhynchospora pubera]